MRELDDLDRLLNAALATYAEPAKEPGRDSGLEQRILARIAAARVHEQPLKFFRARRRISIPWAVTLAAAAVLLLVLLLERQPWRRSSKRAQEAARAQTSAPAGTSELPARIEAYADAKGDAKHPRLRNRVPVKILPAPSPLLVAAAKPLPKLDVFPTPQPLSQEEQTLVVVAERTPAPVRKALAEAQAQESPPVHIAAIHIPPLDPPDPGQP